MNEIVELWKNYNTSAELLKEKLGRTSNLVGEYAEYLIKEYLQGELLTASAASADIKAPNGELHQVKSRKTTNNLTTQLGIIRSWNFDHLTIVLFDKKGEIIKSLICQKSISKQYAIYNEHQNGWVISTTDKFLNNPNHIDITKQLRKINNDSEFVFENFSKTEKKLTELKFSNNIRSYSTKKFCNENYLENYSNLNDLAIGKFVRITFCDLIKKNLINKSEVKNLQLKEYSIDKLHIRYPLLKKVESYEKVDKYWKNPVKINGEEFYVCSEWYENPRNNDRPYYNKWLMTIRKKNTE